MKILLPIFLLSLVRFYTCTPESGQDEVRQGLEESQRSSIQESHIPQVQDQPQVEDPPEEDETTPPPQDVKLDVGHVDGAIFTTKNSTVEGVPFKTSAPKDGYRLTEVKDGQESLWTAGDKEFAKMVTVRNDGEYNVSIIAIVKADGKSASKCFSKENGTWKSLKLDEYKEVMKKLKVNLPPPTQHSGPSWKGSTESLHELRSGKGSTQHANGGPGSRRNSTDSSRSQGPSSNGSARVNVESPATKPTQQNAQVDAQHRPVQHAHKPVVAQTPQVAQQNAQVKAPQHAPKRVTVNQGNRRAPQGVHQMRM